MSGKTSQNCAIIIPIYKENISADDELSLRQCLRILGDYPIIFAVPKKLNCEKYMCICSEYKSSVKIETFKDKFFCGYNGYNALLTHSGFYDRFLEYEYILICQLDTFIFKNDLVFWCEQNYDYIGAPYFELLRNATTPKRTDFFNGGFSLRKTAVFRHLAKTKMRSYSRLFLTMSKCDQLMKNPNIYNLLQRSFLFALTRLWYTIFKIEVSEDFLWSQIIRRYGKIAPFNEALRFSFDSCPEHAFKLNGDSLPFGCHGWTAYYNRRFWEQFM